MGGVMHRIALWSHNADQRPEGGERWAMNLLYAHAHHTHAHLLFLPLPGPPSPYSTENRKKGSKGRSYMGKRIERRNELRNMIRFDNYSIDWLMGWVHVLMVWGVRRGGMLCNIVVSIAMAIVVAVAVYWIIFANVYLYRWARWGGAET